METIAKFKISKSVKIAVYALLLIGIYYSALSWLILTDWAREDFNYGYLIPMVVLYLLWEKRGVLTSLPSTPSWNGLILLIPGFLLFWLGELGGEFLTLYVSLWLLVVGLCWLHLGWNKLKKLAFPLIISLAMFPPPSFIYNKLSVGLKLISSQLGVAMIQAYGLSAYREGNIIDLGFTQLQVVDACSGLRFLFPLIILSLLMAYFFRAHLWKKAVLVASSVPLAIVTNSLRIALTGILYEAWGARVAEGFFHGFSGWFIFMFSLAVLLAEMWILTKLPPRKRPAGDKGETGEDQPVMEEPVHTEPDASLQAETVSPSFWRGLVKPPHFLAAAGLLGLTLVLSQGIEFREKIPITRALDQFPLEIGEWTGVRQDMEQKFIDTLDLSDYAIIEYQNNKGEHINFYVAYYESQRKGESIHSPETCLPGSGWIFNQAGTAVLPFTGGDGRPVKVNRAFMAKNTFKQLSYYWFAQRGRILTNAYQLKIFVFWDALTRQRTDGALVRLITPVYEFEKLEDAEKRLQDFTREITVVLEEFIPGADL